MKKDRSIRGKLSSDGKSISQGRHKNHCTICSHPYREEIEQAFLTWDSPSAIAKKYGVSRDSLYRHAHAFSLLDKRRRNLPSALERIIERAGDVEVSATAVVGAVAAYARINARGQWVERTEHVNLNELFNRMTREEMEAYAEKGTLPVWFEHTVGATVGDSRGDPNER